MIMASGSSAFLRIDGPICRFSAYRSGSPHHPFGKQIPEISLSFGDTIEKLLNRLHISPGKIEAIGLLGSKDTLLEAFHGPADDPTRFVTIYPQLVHLIGEHHNGAQVRVADLGAPCRELLIFRLFSNKPRVGTFRDGQLP